VRHDVAEIDKAMTGHPVPEDIVVTRGTDLGYLGPISPRNLEGTIMHQRAYTSTSLGGPANSFQTMDAVMHIKVPKGTPALWMEKASFFDASERELLLGRGLDIRVDRVLHQDGQ
jgi:ADP-ribosyltransferase exoenzyme